MQIIITTTTTTVVTVPHNQRGATAHQNQPTLISIQKREKEREEPNRKILPQKPIQDTLQFIRQRVIALPSPQIIKS